MELASVAHNEMLFDIITKLRRNKATNVEFHSLHTFRKEQLAAEFRNVKQLRIYKVDCQTNSGPNFFVREKFKHSPVKR